MIRDEFLLSGSRICVEHEDFGVLFAYLFDGDGDLLVHTSDYQPYYTMHIEELIKELYRWGFIVYYQPNKDLSSSQLEYLNTLQGLGFDKIRIAHVWKLVNGEKQFDVMVLAFQSGELGNWLNNNYDPSYDEVSSALMNGVAINLTDISKTRNYNWDWLDFVGSIEDILNDSLDDDIYYGDSYA